MSKLRAIVYFDGFNFYNGCLKNSRRPAQWALCKWLNLEAYCDLLLGGYEVQHIRYFTAEVKPLPNDLEAPQRQQAYFRALERCLESLFTKGSFMSTQNGTI